MAAHRAHKERVARMEGRPGRDVQERIEEEIAPAVEAVAPVAMDDPWETLACGEANAMAVAAAKVAIRDQRSARQPTYNPLYLYGPSGSGKSHLLRAVDYSMQMAGRRVHRVTAEQVLYADGLSHDMLDDIDVLIIDNAHYVFATGLIRSMDSVVTACVSRGKQVLISADRLPSELHDVDNNQRAALSRGLIVHTAAPEYAIRKRIAQNRVDELEEAGEWVDFSEEAIDAVATTISWSGHDIDGAINRIVVAHRITGEPVTAEATRAWLKDLLDAQRSVRPKMRDIKQVVARHYKVRVSDMESARRPRLLVRPRQVAMYLCKRMTLHSLPEIGRAFGGRDHTTVLHAVRRVESFIEAKDTRLLEDIATISRLLNWSAE